MTVGELRELLEQYPEDAEVRLMAQESWPFEHAVHGVISSAEIVDDDDGEDPQDWNEQETVSVGEGRQLKYGNKRAWR